MGCTWVLKGEFLESRIKVWIGGIDGTITVGDAFSRIGHVKSVIFSEGLRNQAYEKNRN